MKFFASSWPLIALTGTFFYSVSYAQDFEFEGTDHPGHFFIELPDDTAGVFAAQQLPFGGISAIEYTGTGNNYFLLSDGLPARYYTFSIDTRSSLDCQLQNISYLPNSAIRGEGIRIDGARIFLTDERTTGGVDKTFVWKMEGAGNLEEIQALGDEYRGEMFENSGFEGLALSPDHEKLYLALERALPGRPCRFLVPIIEYSIATAQKTEYFYPFQSGGKNVGISEIMTLNDSMLLVIERDYIKAEDRNTVNFYTVNLWEKHQNVGDCCGTNPSAPLLKPRLVFSMDTLTSLGGKSFKVNNVEGAVLSPDGKYLLLVSDNNFGNKGKATPTQLIALKVKDKN